MAGVFLALATGVAAATTPPGSVAGATDPGVPVDCSGSLQSLVDGAPPGATLRLPPCVYREAVELDRPIHLVADGTELRGSDVWTGWHPSGPAWESDRIVPDLGDGGQCRPGSDRCGLPEQVFVDGAAQARSTVDSPGPGTFALTPDRRVLLGSDPTGHSVEVTVRERWLQVSASGVTIEGMTFRHAGNGPQAEQAALRVSGGVDGFELLGSRLFEAHGTLLGIVGGSGHRIVNSELARAGQQGFGFAGTSDTELRGSTIADNNLDGFDPNWEAGAGKASRARGLIQSGNTVDRNGGPGLWCDIDCQSVAISGNRIAGNDGPGILFEVSSGASIADNVVTDNGWGNAGWGWGGGIVVSSSGDVEVARNTLAWNADGISVISQGRNDRPPDAGTRITVHGNTVLAAPEPSDPDNAYLEAWLQDWPGPLFAGASGNRGWDERFWSTSPETSAIRFAWSGDLSSVDRYRSTPGGSDAQYLSAAEMEAVAAAAGISDASMPHEVTVSLGSRLRALAPLLLAGGLALLLALGTIAVAYRRRRRRSSDR